MRCSHRPATTVIFVKGVGVAAFVGVVASVIVTIGKFPKAVHVVRAGGRIVIFELVGRLKQTQAVVYLLFVCCSVLVALGRCSVSGVGVVTWMRVFVLSRLNRACCYSVLDRSIGSLVLLLWK
jgi:hypothetical protein